ncbi:hypothetical protein O7635_24025 [Asanoa sp. WMMD1127]|uniref:hypothetical protein n=1 Tax=Asanoa sp. WMMD1127 TaxID=3016107 RepID=UPI0024170C3F|nr:hypothetical protein [Asanoa sp. WMMD1127]MDG4824928.1 hypothetical protein [Asanoa sp. WMMD1127]
MTTSIDHPHSAPTQPPQRLDRAPAFRTVARYPTFVSAEQATDHLHGLGVSSEDVTIVGRGLVPSPAADRLVAWRSTGRAAALGAAIFGLLGALLGLIDVLPPAAAYVTLSGIALGAGLGAAVGYLRHRLLTSRDGLTRGGVRADTYQVQVDIRHVDPKRAEHRLARFWPEQ